MASNGVQIFTMFDPVRPREVTVLSSSDALDVGLALAGENWVHCFLDGQTLVVHFEDETETVIKFRTPEDQLTCFEVMRGK